MARKSNMDPPVISLMPPAKGTPAVAPNVMHRLPEVEAAMPRWELIVDCLAGQDAVKKKLTKYLPKPSPEDLSTANDLRYTDYVTRALFFNVVANTVSGLVGQVFNSDPVSEYPNELEPLWYDANGQGVTLIQQAKKALTAVLSLGRCGILVDFPNGPLDEEDNPRPFNRQEVMDGVARPTLQYYGPSDIINWRYTMVGAISVLSMVVLVEDYIIKDDGFEIERGQEARVLRLTNGVYTVEQWRRTDEKQEGPFTLIGTSAPTDNTGKTFNYIPFYFVGAMNNDAQIDKPPMYDMAVLNLAHYRNSADYEDSVYMVGQPTPYFAGLTKAWVENVLKNEVRLGSRGAVPLPAGGTAGLIQAEPNSMVKEAMESKERQMVAIGAQIVEDKKVQRTLGEAKMENTIVVSTLTSCARNVSQAIENALIAAAQFATANVDPDKIIFNLSTDFAIAKLSPDERRQLLAEWTGGLLAFSEARSQLRQSGIATLDDEEAAAEIDLDQQKAIDLAQDAMGGAVDDAGNPIAPGNDSGADPAAE